MTSSSRPTPAALRSRARRWLAPGLAALALGGCGGGVYVDIGGDFYDDDRPSVVLTASADAAAPGESVVLEADARDDYGIDSVTLYRYDGAGSVELGRQYRRPFEFLVTIPASAGSQLEFFAVARDDAGQTTSSRTVVVDVLR